MSGVRNDTPSGALPLVAQPQSIFSQDDLNRQSVIGEWQLYQAEERQLRRRYAELVFRLLFGEVIMIFALLIGQGVGLITLEPWTARLFYSGVIGEVAVLARTVITHLFPGPTHQIKMLEVALQPASVDVGEMRRSVVAGAQVAARESHPA